MDLHKLALSLFGLANYINEYGHMFETLFCIWRYYKLKSELKDWEAW